MGQPLGAVKIWSGVVAAGCILHVVCGPTCCADPCCSVGPLLGQDCVLLSLEDGAEAVVPFCGWQYSFGDGISEGSVASKIGPRVFVAKTQE